MRSGKNRNQAGSQRSPVRVNMGPGAMTLGNFIPGHLAEVPGGDRGTNVGRCGDNNETAPAHDSIYARRLRGDGAPGIFIRWAAPYQPRLRYPFTKLLSAVFEVWEL